MKTKKFKLSLAAVFMIFIAVLIVLIGYVSQHGKIIKYHLKGNVAEYTQCVYFSDLKKGDNTTLAGKMAYIDSSMEDNSATNRSVTLYCQFYGTSAKDTLYSIPLRGLRAGETIIHDVINKDGSVAENQLLTILAIKDEH